MGTGFVEGAGAVALGGSCGGDVGDALGVVTGGALAACGSGIAREPPRGQSPTVSPTATTAATSASA